MSKDITLGILGSGQLGTELVRSAKKIGINKIIVFSDDKDGPAQNFCDEYIYSDYKNISNLKKFIDMKLIKSVKADSPVKDNDVCS